MPVAIKARNVSAKANLARRDNAALARSENAAMHAQNHEDALTIVRRNRTKGLSFRQLPERTAERGR
jgi:hypothetical protein